MSYGEAFALLWQHLWGALGIGLIFGAGMLLAIPVLRRRFRPLLFLPDLFARMLHNILAKKPTTVRLAAFIFLFNSNAIFIYMLTGLVPKAPAFLAFFTGLNVAAASILAQKRFPRTDIGELHVPLTARIGAVLTFALELPSLWFSLAMGLTMETSLRDLLSGADATDIRQRILVYGMVIVPTLALSALAEAHAICSAFRAAGAKKES